MLIIGGLIIVAVLALLGAFLMARGGGKEEKTVPTTPASVTEPQAAAPATPTPQAVPEDVSTVETIYTGARTDGLSGSRPLPAGAPYSGAPGPLGHAHPDDLLSASLPLYALRQEIHMLQGQVYQLSEHIQILNQHAHEIEQRLNRVHEMLPDKDQDGSSETVGSPKSYNEGHKY